MDISELIKETETFLRTPPPTDFVYRAFPLVERLLDVVKEREWKTIDSAPSNVRVLLKFHENDNHPVIGILKGHYWFPDDYGKVTHTWADPTHWQFLPLPPKPESGGE